MNILNEAEKLINSPLAQRLIGMSAPSQVAPAPAVVGVKNPVAPHLAMDYKPLLIGGSIVFAMVIGLVYVLKAKKG